MFTLSEKDYANLVAQRDQALALLSEADEYLRDIRAENLDGTEPALGELLERCTTFFIESRNHLERYTVPSEDELDALRSNKPKP